jgi:alkanesulfonate monooxygenase SsuD/methylene tetrahydromethanopterin reductase-like flavin-dependent oxidoreductase (luciferase family)
MPDYGHPLQFGTFVTPLNADPQEPVRLAHVSEDAGLDLVTFQDHPYQPRFHDTWTLLSFVGARTERVTLAANVMNLPMRPPAVLARAVASLDLLTGGRVALGIGAGGFWDAIASMGGTRLDPGQAVTALEEALRIIRGIWDVGQRGVLRVDGEHHRVSGAKRGPAPAHDVPIWVGALKPRMLRFVGREADGWLPSQSYLRDGGLARGNAIIDDAAREAGRDPADVRRLLNIAGPEGTVQEWVHELVRLALDDGVGTFILMSDDADLIRLFGREVAPTVREIVARERV